FVDYNHSPISFLLTSIAIPNASLFGIMISLTELIVGVLVILGLFTRLAALVGLLLNTTLWLTASWGQQPFYTGWDLPYMFGWLTLLLAGAGPFSLDQRLMARSFGPLTVSEERRNFLVRGGATVGVLLALAIGGGVAITGLLSRGGSSSSGGNPATGGQGGSGTQPAVPSPTQTGSSGATPQGGAAGTPASSPAGSGNIQPESTPAGGPTDTPLAAATALPAGGVAIAKISDIPAGNGARFVNPTTQEDAWVIHLSSGDFVAFSAICTHAGCSVNYNSGQKLFICPCHGSEYDPANNAAVVRRPAPKPLAKIQIRVDQASGNIYYVSG
ncbi:MAG: hypothetical protein DLM69_06355, partial [Candidatus Chloroheliales bacterium]